MSGKVECLSRVVKGKTFADVGGLWGTKGEMATVAMRQGARSAAMIDAMPLTAEWWGKFREHCKAQGINNIREIVGDIANAETTKKLGQFDVVHCSGVMYHVPDCFGFVGNLLSITNEYLLLASQVIPPVIHNGKGTIVISDSEALCAPCLSQTDREIMYEYYKQAGRDIACFNAETRFINKNMRANYGPWWWLFTSGFMVRLIEAFNVKIVWGMPANEWVYQVLIKK